MARRLVQIYYACAACQAAGLIFALAGIEHLSQRFLRISGLCIHEIAFASSLCKT